MDFIQIGDRCINMEAVAFVRWNEEETLLDIFFAGALECPLFLKQVQAIEAWTHFRRAAGTLDPIPLEEMQEALKKGGA